MPRCGAPRQGLPDAVCNQAGGELTAGKLDGALAFGDGEGQRCPPVNQVGEFAHHASFKSVDGNRLGAGDLLSGQLGQELRDVAMGVNSGALSEFAAAV